MPGRKLPGWLILLLAAALAGACARRPRPRPVPSAGPGAAVTTPGQAAAAGYSIQVGAFRNLENAVRLAASLKDLDLNAYYFQARTGLYKVRFGDFRSRWEAEEQAALARRVGYIQDYFIVNPDTYVFNRPSPDRSSAMRAEIVALAESYLGLPYRWGGDSPENGFDCSGLTLAVYRMSGLSLPRTSGQQFRLGEAVSRKDLRPGDLVFFHGGREGRVTHVGIYIGAGRFIHAPGKNKVIRREKLGTPYFKQRFAGGRRYF
jgi:cell wall-associated NlpC family hydrolase